MKKPKRKSLLTDSEVRKIYESWLPEYRPDQKCNLGYGTFGPSIMFSEMMMPKYRNVITRTIEEKRAIVYKMKSKYLNHKTV